MKILIKQKLRARIMEIYNSEPILKISCPVAGK